MMQNIPKPQPGEYNPAASGYMELVPEDGHILDHLEHNFEAVRSLVQKLPEAKLNTPFAPGEWTVKTILVHLMDCERVYSYRALRFARHDSTELPGFDQELYAADSGADERSLESILEEYAAVRAATQALFKNLPEDTWIKGGIASKNPLTVRAALYQIVGHELHHLNSIRQNYG